MIFTTKRFFFSMFFVLFLVASATTTAQAQVLCSPTIKYDSLSQRFYEYFVFTFYASGPEAGGNWKNLFNLANTATTAGYDVQYQMSFYGPQGTAVVNSAWFSIQLENNPAVWSPYLASAAIPAGGGFFGTLLGAASTSCDSSLQNCSLSGTETFGSVKVLVSSKTCEAVKAQTNQGGRVNFGWTPVSGVAQWQLPLFWKRPNEITATRLGTSLLQTIPNAQGFVVPGNPGVKLGGLAIYNGGTVAQSFTVVVKDSLGVLITTYQTPVAVPPGAVSKVYLGSLNLTYPSGSGDAQFNITVSGSANQPIDLVGTQFDGTSASAAGVYPQ